MEFLLLIFLTMLDFSNIFFLCHNNGTNDTAFFL